MHLRYLAVAAIIIANVRAADAQTSATEHVALGDRAHAAMTPIDALRHYEAALAADSNSYEALWRASRESIDLAEYEKDKGKQTQWFKDGEHFARRAVAVNPRDAEGHFQLARSLGKVALTKGVKERVTYGKEVRAQAMEALKLDANHPGALHVMGRWNAEIMRLSGFERFFARNFLGGDVFGSASWRDARHYMERSVEVDAARLTHHLDLADVYLDLAGHADGDDRANLRTKAREQLQLVVAGPATDYNDQFYKLEAQKRLDKLK